jgi:signal transduction histidine kinase/ligand-binding sensor domain-containing protein/DNA-binding response OmpR family regulator
MAKTFIFLLSFLITINCLSQDQLKFRHLTVKDGLSNNNVLCVLQDQKGFIWFGTANGLNRYDGYTFKVFQHLDTDSTSLSDNRIRTMAEDNQGRIWIGTNNGLNCFDPATETCKHYLYNTNDSSTISDNRISALLFSKNNILWIGTENGLNRFDPATSKNTRLTDQLKSRTNTIANEINSITEDADGSIWIGMWWGGLKRIDPANLVVTSFFSHQTDPNGLSNDNVLSVFCAKDNTLWITNYMGGLRRMDPRTCRYLPNEGLTKTLDLGTICQDKSGNIWIKSKPGSLVISPPAASSCTTISTRPGDDSSISTGSISGIFCDRTGIVWIATDKGISFYNPEVMKFAKYYHQLDIGKRDYCKAFFQDRSNRIWISIFDVGLVKYNPVNGETVTLSQNIADLNSINHNNVNGIFEDKSGEIWLATDNGICTINPKTGRVIKRMLYNNENSPAIINGVQAHTNGRQSRFFWPVEGSIFDVENQKKWFLSDDGRISLNDLKIKCIIADRKGDLWLGTEFLGLKHFQTATGQLSDYVNMPSDSNSISGNTINDICEDHSGNLWIATSNGLNRFNPEKNKFTVYTKKQGLSASECFSVKEDSHGKLWISNSSGLDKFDVQSGTVTKYGEADGISLNQSGLYQSDKGYFFGGHSENGFYMYHPDSISSSKTPQSALITDFFIFNESVPISNAKVKSVLTRSILETNEIILNHRQTVFGFEFSSLDYTDHEKCRFAWKLDGFDNKWFYSDGNNRRVTYTNLNPGTYLFRVKSANGGEQNSGIEKSIKITVLPPWWKTGWALTFYFIAISALLVMIRKYFADKRRLQYEVEIQKIEADKSKEMAQLKQHFFTNISHEFRTPLTLISGPIEKLIRNVDHIDREIFLEQFQLIQRNAKRLSQLTNQLLDIRKLETGSMKLEIYQGDLIGFIQNLSEGFNPLAESKQINFQTIIPENADLKQLYWFDPDKTTKIITNLLSNAFRFTPAHGQIILQINREQEAIPPNRQPSDFLRISIEDTGIGIPEDQLLHIFDRFFRVENSQNHSAEGTGIGLALTKELVNLLTGTISVESKPGEGSKFTVMLPVSKAHFSNFSEITQPELILSPTEIKDHIISTVPKSLTSLQVEDKDENLPLILLVEDNADMRAYICDILKDHYRLMEAENGSLGIRMALEVIPDLIISDVMMPEKNGYELTQILKNDERTSHIPIVLLTALNTSENRMEGLENEADEYLTKPFDEQMLLLNIKNMIKSRQKLKNRLIKTNGFSSGKKAIELFPEKPDLQSTEQKFITRLMILIEENISSPAFDVQKLSLEIGMEASVLHRKLKAVINQSPGDFIRSMRMKRAAQLLEDKSLSISEVASMVGFENNISYFSTVFRKYSGKAPKEYQNSL